MKKFYFTLIIALLFTSCAPAPIKPTITVVPVSTTTPTLAPVLTLTPTSTSTPTITPTPLPITFIYQDDVPASGRALQEQAAYKAYAYYSQYANLGPTTIYTFSDINQFIDQIFPAIQADVPTSIKSRFVQDWIAGGGGNTSAKDIVAISSGFLPWKDDVNSCYKSKNVAHELFHILQSRLMHHGLFRPALDYGPEWLKEGSAEMMGNQIADGLNGCSYQQTLDAWIGDSNDKNFSLKEVEGGNFNAKVGFWSVAPLAVDQLTKSNSNGEKSLIDYYSAIGNGKKWREAFKLAFGMSVEDFYADFGAFQETIKVTLDTSVCLPQSDHRVKCLGRKPYNTNWYRYIFNIPFAVNTQPQQWTVEPTCKLAGYGANGSNIANNLLVDVDESTNGICHVKFTFNAKQQVTVDFNAPIDLSIIPTATPAPPVGMVGLQGKVILSAGSLAFDQYVISFCNVKIPQCLPGVLINADGTFFSYLVPGEYLISVNPINGGEALGWYSSKGLVQETTCTEKVQIDKNQEIIITIDPSNIRPCS